MTLGQQQPAESGIPTPDTRHYPTVYHHSPSSVVLQGAAPPPPPPQHQQQVAGYLVAGPPGGHQGVLQGQPITLQTQGTNHVYSSSTPGPAAFQGSTINQQLLQQHTYIQQPVQQVEMVVNLLHDQSLLLSVIEVSKLIFIMSYRCPHVTAPLPITPTAPASSSSRSSSRFSGPPSTLCPITVFRTKTCPSIKVWTQMNFHKLRD